MEYLKKKKKKKTGESLWMASSIKVKQEAARWCPSPHLNSNHSHFRY